MNHPALYTVGAAVEAAALETALAAVLLVLAGAGLWAVMRHPFWGTRIRGVLRRPVTFLALLVIAGYVLIAWADAVSWKDDRPDVDPEYAFHARQPRSLFDRAFAAIAGVPEYAYREGSYSAPLARTEFTDAERALEYRHLLGTTQTGHDTLYTTLKGCKPAVVIGTLPLVFAIPLALLFGVAAGFFGGRVDDLVVYLYSTIASIPGILLLFALIAAFGRGLPQIAIGLGITGWIGLCRLVRAETLKLREMEYVQAAVCLGVSRPRIILRHVLPNLMHIVIITAVLAFSGLVLAESVLSYLGIGLDHSWGAMIDNARGEVSREPAIWWNLSSASFALFGLVLAMNIVGDAIRDALDPRVTSAG
jgi:peptide/nickel transport system permease protein